MTLTTLVSGLSFAEAPRWHNGYLYYSDFYRHVVERVDSTGTVDVVAKVPNQPSGLGWLPSGELLIVSMLDRKLLKRAANGSLTEHADLSAAATWHCNDMVVSQDGTAYVGNFGFDNATRPKDQPPTPAKLAIVGLDGQVRITTQAFKFPNGSVITPDNKQLIVAETMGRRLTAFDISADGSLVNRRTWADLGRHYPDGICLDAQGAIWVADPVRSLLLRVEEGGNILQSIDPGRPVYACMLGGDNGKRLFACTAKTAGDEAAQLRSACIEYIDVDVPHAGLP